MASTYYTTYTVYAYLSWPTVYWRETKQAETDTQPCSLFISYIKSYIKKSFMGKSSFFIAKCTPMKHREEYCSNEPRCSLLYRTALIWIIYRKSSRRYTNHADTDFFSYHPADRQYFILMIITVIHAVHRQSQAYCNWMECFGRRHFNILYERMEIMLCCLLQTSSFQLVTIVLVNLPRKYIFKFGNFLFRI